MTGNNIFVFGSNPEGRNSAGAAKAAMNFGAKYGVGRGLQGNTYALVTKNLKAGFTEKATGVTYEKDGFRSVSSEQISDNVKEMYDCARENPHLKFFITYQHETWPNGQPKKSLNGYTSEEMWGLLTDNKDIPDNMRFHESFKKLALKNQNTNDKKEEFEFFWKAGSPFSQWHPAPFKYKDKQFISAEQFMMYSKAKLFGDEEVANKIMHLNNALLSKDLINGNIESGGIVNDKKNLDVWSKIQKKFKTLGREVSGFDEKIWNEKRVSIVTVASREKFEQNPKLKEKLLATGNKTLTESSPWDKVWGIGLEKHRPEAQDRKQWKGLNLLGEILTNVKQKMQQELKQNNGQRKRNRP
jgi:hypothetical protein